MGKYRKAKASYRRQAKKFFVTPMGHAEGRQMYGIKSRESGEIYASTLTLEEALRYQASFDV